MASFMYLFRFDPAAVRSMSPEQMQQNMKKWMDWRTSLEKGGHLKRTGDRLDPGGKVVRGKTKTVTDGPFIEVKDSVAGHMMVEAKDLDQAAELAKGCPVLDGDGSVEVRPILTT